MYPITRAELTKIIADSCDAGNIKSWQRWLLMRVARKTREVAFGTMRFEGVKCPWGQAHLGIPFSGRKFWIEYDERCLHRTPVGTRVFKVTDLQVTSSANQFCGWCNP